MGLSRDQAYGVRVPGVPANIAATTQLTFTMASPTRGRYVVVSREWTPKAQDAAYI